MFAGCKKSDDKSGNNNQTPKDEQYVIYNLATEPDTIDPGLETTVGASTVCNQVFEGLMRLNNDNKPEPAVAESYDYDPAAPTKYVFHIRKEAKWSDGKPVTAQDFEYAWKRVLNPASAADYANQLWYLKNGLAFNSGKEGVTADDVGVKAKDDYTLEVELEYPTTYFLELCSFPTLMPVRKDIVEANPEQWTQKPETYIGNGPFKMTEWVHDSHISFVKNENYWNKSKVKLDKLKFVMIVQSSSGLAAFETGEVDYIDDIPTYDIPRLLQEKKMVVTNYIGTYYICPNNKKRVLNDPKVRKALSLAIDRPLLIEAVWKDGRKPATAWVPYGITDVDPAKQFRDVGGDYYDGKGNIEEAKKLLAEAGYPDGKNFPQLEYAYNNNETHAKIAQAVADMWKKNLGITVKLNEVDWKVFVPQRKAGDYEISRHGWIGDYMDPMTFLDLFVTGDGNNDPKFENTQYDELVRGAKRESDPTKRMQMLHQAEDILIKENMAIIPVAFYVRDVCMKPYVKGVHQVPTGTIYFDRAYVEGKNAK
jgi:oligopeptide transport system substrate-binding protein